MPATIKNLTEGRLAVPIVDYNFGPREVRRFEFQEYDVLVNDPTVVHLVNVGAISVEADAGAGVPPHAVTHEAAGSDVVAHQDLSGAGVNTHAQIDTYLATAASILERYSLAAKAPDSFKQLTYTGTQLSRVRLYSGTTVQATAGRTLQFNDTNPDTITASAGDFTTEDFSAGEYVGVQGTTNNDGVYLIGSVAPTTITLDAAETLVTEGPLSSGASLHALDTHLFTQDLSYTGANLTEVLVTWEVTSDQVKKILTYSGSDLVQVSLQAV